MKLNAFYPLALVTAATALGATSGATLTYNKDIAPILYENCASCHRPGEVAPFSLLTYQDTAKRAALIATITKARTMPPWKAEPGHGDFKNTRRLTDEQIAMLDKWVKSGTPEGKASDKPPVPQFTDGWQAGKPDQVFTIPAKYALSPDGPDQFRCFVIPLELTEDKFVGAIEFRPENRRIVHHALVFSDPNQQGRKLAAGSADGSYSCFGSPGFAAGLLGGWAPGSVPAKVEAGYSAPIKKGTDLVLQIHYHPSGKPEEDRSSLGLTFAGAPTKGRALVLMANNKIDIPAGDANYVIKASRVLPSDADIVAITPHAHYLCKDMKVDAYLPDGTVKPLIWISDWDFNWQGGYRYVEPVHLPKGTKVEMVYTYDNSSANPRQPKNPPVRVTYGEETTNEMGLAFLSLALPTPADATAFMRALYFAR